MGTALSISKTDEVERKRGVLGPIERVPRKSAVDRVLAAGKTAPGSAECPSLLRETVIEELLAVASFGGTELAELVHAVEAGHHGEAVFRLVKAGVSAHHASELIGRLGRIVTGHAAHAAAAGAGSIALAALEGALVHATLALAAIAQRHRSGDRQVAICKYAEVWSRVVTCGLFDGEMLAPKHEPLPHLEDARVSAVHDAVETLHRLGGPELAAALQLELGSKENAQRALATALVERGGVKNAVFHERAVK